MGAGICEESIATLFYRSDGKSVMGVRVWVSGILAVIGGFLMVLSGYTSKGLLYAALPYLEKEISVYLSGFAAIAATLAITILELLITLGGLTVLAGGVVILLRHTRTGRLLIYLGGGAGLFGLLISFGYTTYRLGLNSAVAYAPYWVGLAMAVAARRLAKGA